MKQLLLAPLAVFISFLSSAQTTPILSFEDSTQLVSKDYNSTKILTTTINVEVEDTLEETFSYNVTINHYTTTDKDVVLITTNIELPLGLGHDTLVEICFKIVDDTANRDLSDESFALIVSNDEGDLCLTKITVKKSEEPKQQIAVFNTLTKPDTLSVGIFHLRNQLETKVTLYSIKKGFSKTDLLQLTKHDRRAIKRKKRGSVMRYRKCLRKQKRNNRKLLKLGVEGLKPGDLESSKKTLENEISTCDKEIKTLQAEQKDRKNYLTKKVKRLYKQIENIDKKGTKKTKLEKRVNALKCELEKHKHQPNESEKSEKTTTKKIQIKSVWLKIENGRIQKIHVVSEENEIFINRYPISVTCLEDHVKDKLIYLGTTADMESKYLTLGDVISYEGLTSRVTFPTDCTITLDANHIADTVKFTSSPIDFFDIRTYSDTKGLSGEANGLIQTEANLRFIGSTNWGQKFFLFFPYVNLNFSYSKFDSKFDSLERIPSFNDRKNNDLLLMVQQSNISFRIECELFRFSRVYDSYLNIGHQIFVTNIKTEDSSGRIFTPAFYTTIGGTMFSFPRIRCNFKIPFMLTYLQDQPFRDYKRNEDFLIIPEIELIIDPLRKKNTVGSKTNDLESGVSIFGRLRYFDMPDYRGNNFWQIQFGVQIPLTEALGLK